MRRRGYLTLGMTAGALGGVLTTSLVFGQSRANVTTPSKPSSAATVAAGNTTPQPRETLPATLRARPVRLNVDGFAAWAMLDRRTGQIAGSENLKATNSVESMIKIWIVSDFLRRAAEDNKAPSQRRLAQARDAIRDSDDDAAQSIYVAGGRDAVVSRMIRICDLTDTKIAGPGGIDDRGWWSYTRISARDAVRLGECVKNGTAAGARWTTWVLDQMARVRGSAAPKDQHSTRGGGRWGIIDGLPPGVRNQGPISIKNGWTLINADQKWHVNCLAVAQDWVLAVLLRYPGRLGLQYGANACKSVASQLVTPQPSD